LERYRTVNSIAGTPDPLSVATAPANKSLIRAFLPKKSVPHRMIGPTPPQGVESPVVRVGVWPRAGRAPPPVAPGTVGGD